MHAHLDVPTVARRVGRRPRAWRAVMGRYLFILPAAVFMLSFFIYPVIYNLIPSVQDVGIGTLVSGNAPFIGLANYRAVLQMAVFHEAARNTAIFTVVSLVCQFTIGLGLALFFNRAFPLSRLIRALILLPWLLPFVVTGTAYRWLFNDPGGFVNYLLGDVLHVISPHTAWLAETQLALPVVIIANIWIGIPFNMVLLYGGLQSMPPDVYEAAAIDGAGWWTSFWRITLPLMRPVIAIVLVLGLIGTIKVFGLIYLMTGGGPANATQTFLTLSYQLSFTNFQFGQGAAAGTVVAIIALIGALVYLALLRREQSWT